MAFPPSSSSHCTMVNRMLWASDRSGMEKSEEQFFPGGVSMGTGQGWSHVTRSSRRILQLALRAYGAFKRSHLTLRP